MTILSRVQLLRDDLAELAEGTTIMGKPDRTPPKFGPIASPESGSAKVRAWQQSYDPPSPTPGAGHNYTEIVAPVPIAPIPLLHRTFEVRTSTTTLSAPLTAFCDSFDEERPESPDVSVADENEPPSRLCNEEQEFADFEIPMPKLRGIREPFGVLHYDLARAPSSSGVQNPLTDEDDLEDEERCKLLGVFYEGENVASGYRLKGWARLRSKAPQAIDITVIDAALKHQKESSQDKAFHDLDYVATRAPGSPLKVLAETSKAPHAPKMTNVPLPPEASRVAVSLKENNLDIATLVSQKKFSLPMTPCRQGLLNILNRGPTP